MRTLAYVTYDEVSDYLTNVNRIVPIPLWTLRYIHRRFNASDRTRQTARGARRYSPLGDSRSARRNETAGNTKEKIIERLP